MKDKLSGREAAAEGTDGPGGWPQACLHDPVLRPAYEEVYLDWMWPCLPESTGMLLFNAAIVEIMSAHSHARYTSLPDFMPHFTMTRALGLFVPVTSARWGGPLAVARLPGSAFSDQLEITRGK